MWEVVQEQNAHRWCYDILGDLWSLAKSYYIWHQTYTPAGMNAVHGYFYNHQLDH